MCVQLCEGIIAGADVLCFLLAVFGLCFLSLCLPLASFYGPLLVFYPICLSLFPPQILPSSRSSTCTPHPPRRHLTSVSWDRPRRQMPTVSSADRWGQFICLERLSALLRSWPSISWAQDTRLEERKNKLLCK